MSDKPLILLTGCGGYVGGEVLKEAIRRDYSIRCVDNLIYGGKHIAGLINDRNVEFIYGDIRDSTLISRVLDGVDSVVHLAAIVGDLPCQVAPTLSVQINFKATRNLALEARAKGVERFVFASTCSNYGITDSSKPASEESKLNPVSLYAETKIDCERFLHEMSNSAFHTTSLRFGTAYGMSFRTRFDLLVNSFVYESIVDKEIIVFAADSWRPYIHVSDMARIICDVIEAPKESISGEIFNAGSNKENYTKRDIVEVLQTFFPDLKISFVVKDDDKRSYRVDFSKLEKVFGFTPSKTIKDGFSELITAFKVGVLTKNDYHANKLETLKKYYADQEKKLRSDGA